MNYLYFDTTYIILALKDRIPMFDVNSKCDVFVQCPVLFVACDNPRASEFCHHMGSSANFFCKICEVGFSKDKYCLKFAVMVMVTKTVVLSVIYSGIYFEFYRQREKRLQKSAIFEREETQKPHSCK